MKDCVETTKATKNLKKESLRLEQVSQSIFDNLPTCIAIFVYAVPSIAVN